MRANFKMFFWCADFVPVDQQQQVGEEEEEEEDGEDLNPRLRSPVHQFLQKNLKVRTFLKFHFFRKFFLFRLDTVWKFNWMYVAKFSTISLYLTKLYVTSSFAIASSVKYGEIRQNFLNV